MTPPSPTELIPGATRVLDCVKDMPPEQQQAVLEAACSIARASVELRQRLYMTGSILAKIGK